MSERRVLLFTKPAVPGRVKTRLIGTLTSVQAAELHRALVEDLVTRLAGGRFELRLAWALEPGDELPPGPAPGVRQAEGDLGRRLFAALSAAAAGSESVAAIGGDHPQLGRDEIEAAFETLERGEADVVLGPAVDGGYFLIALSRGAVRRELFSDVPWSTNRVLALTLERCSALGLRAHLLPEAADVDTPADLARLTAQLAVGRAVCPRTATLLRSWGRLTEEPQPCAS